MRFCCLLLAAWPILAQPSKPLPPPGIAIPEPDRVRLAAAIQPLATHTDPDILIFHKAIDWALRYNEFHQPKEIAVADQLIATARQRLALLPAKPWLAQPGLVPLGYRSRIDDSIQPYGLVLPPTFNPQLPRTWRLDIWFHGRGETLSELAFLNQRLRQAGEFTPPDTIVAHLYGRYCNANKFAGEIDLFEALADIQSRYQIDPDRIVVRGFSMGGAATWHIATHHAGLWAAAAPGAGFAETEEYLKLTPEQKKALPWWEPRLWNWYDATAYAANLFNLPIVAYSGEKDRQIQAAQVMEKRMKAEGLRLTHVIGPNTEHKYHPDSKPEINRRIDALAARGRTAAPRRVRFTTFTLRYPRMKWISVAGLNEHWERARVDAEWREPSFFTIRAENVTALSLIFEPGQFPFAADTQPTITINGFPLKAPAPESDLSWRVEVHQSEGGKWNLGPAPAGLAKRPGLHGPIDDAFLSRFLFVRPTGAPKDPVVHAWALREMERAGREWRNVFRGEVRIKNDTEVTPADLAESNLVLWGDAGSNQLLGRIASQLPAQLVEAGQALLMIYPNPLAPARYVVLNSGFTFREEANTTNARQIPMLPDWAVVDVTLPPTSRYPGRIVAGGFFDEKWQIRPGDPLK